MAKDITFDAVKLLRGTIAFNYAVLDPDTEITSYYLGAMTFRVKGTGNGAVNDLNQTITFGNPSATKFTPQQIYTGVKNKLGQDVADVLKDLYIAAINEDISA